MRGGSDDLGRGAFRNRADVRQRRGRLLPRRMHSLVAPEDAEERAVDVGLNQSTKDAGVDKSRAQGKNTCGRLVQASTSAISAPAVSSTSACSRATKRASVVRVQRFRSVVRVSCGRPTRSFGYRPHKTCIHDVSKAELWTPRTERFEWEAFSFLKDSGHAPAAARARPCRRRSAAASPPSAALARRPPLAARGTRPHS